MITVFKYPLEPTDYQEIEIKGLMRVLSVEEQNEDIVLYAQVNTEPPRPEYQYDIIEVIILGTGHDRPELKEVGKWNFLGTVKLLEGNLMFHVFYHKKERIC